jgi:TolB-like protein/DNA-binding winged helix-turn-helix (wHTH) protein/Tfp pilus assembly protein PilF
MLITARCGLNGGSIVSIPSEKPVQFGVFTLDTSRASLVGPDGPHPLRPKTLDVLVYLVRNPNRLVSKAELLDAVWPNVFVTENSLVQCISEIREALGRDAASVLKTVAKRGYIFTADETVPSAVAQGAVPAQPPDAPAGDGPPAHVAARTFVATVRRNVVLLTTLLLLAGSAAAVGTWWLVSNRDGWQATVNPDEPSRSRGRMSIAVLPLAALEASTEDYFADGLTEDIISALARFPDLTVLAPRTVASYKGRAPKQGEIARDLKVGYFAEGNVRRAGDRLRITMRLTDAANGTIIWADQFDTDADQVFAIQDEITRQITGALAVRLTNAEQARAALRPPKSLETYELVLRGRDMLSRLTRTATSNARTMFERAIELDPGYAPAWVGLGHADLRAVHLGWTPDPAGTLRRAESHARKAVAIDEFSPAALALLGRIHSRLGEYDRALELLRRAVALNPNDPESNASLGDALLWNGDIEEARKMLDVAVQLDPRLSSEHLFDLAAAYFLLGQHAQAAQVLERTLTRQDSNQFTHALLAAIYAEAGRKEDAQREIAEVRKRNPLFNLDVFGTLFRNPEHREKILAALRSATL